MEQEHRLEFGKLQKKNLWFNTKTLKKSCLRRTDRTQWKYCICWLSLRGKNKRYCRKCRYSASGIAGLGLGFDGGVGSPTVRFAETFIHRELPLFWELLKCPGRPECPLVDGCQSLNKRISSGVTTCGRKFRRVSGTNRCKTVNTSGARPCTLFEPAAAVGNGTRILQVSYPVLFHDRRVVVRAQHVLNPIAQGVLGRTGSCRSSERSQMDQKWVPGTQSFLDCIFLMQSDQISSKSGRNEDPLSCTFVSEPIRK